MTSTLKQSFLRYWLAMNASAAQSAAHAGKAWMAVAVAHALAEQIPALNLPQFLAVLGLAFFSELLDYLDTHPLAGLLPPEAPVIKPIGPEPTNKL